MKKLLTSACLIALLLVIYSYSTGRKMKNEAVYKVAKLTQPMKIDGNWDKPQWRNVPALEIVNYMGTIPKFRPDVKAKMIYDENNLYVIFQVHDKFVRCLTKDINGPVWEDSCCEFFFAPDSVSPEKYFNLEMNCGGTPLLFYNLVPRKESKRLDIEDIKKIEIAHSLPQIIDPEMSDQVDWTLEYRIPIAMLKKYASVTHPRKGVEWRANFYKIAENNSNPHYITWSVIENDKPDFHKPNFFGTLRFE